MDFMISEIGDQRRFEVFLENGGDVKLSKVFFKGKDEVNDINKLMNARNQVDRVASASVIL
jgi:hypothetical protein